MSYYFYMTSMIFPIDIVFLYDIDGFHHFRIFTGHHIDIVFLYDINGFTHRYRIFL